MSPESAPILCDGCCVLCLSTLTQTASGSGRQVQDSDLFEPVGGPRRPPRPPHLQPVLKAQGLSLGPHPDRSS
eukprot:1067143-Rhodomonas_salina.1